MSKFHEAIHSPIPVLVDFYADWCQPCKMQAPILERVAKRTQGEAKILKINVDKNPQVAQKYKVRSIPTLMIFKHGKILWQGAGLQTEKQLEQLLQTYR